MYFIRLISKALRILRSNNAKGLLNIVETKIAIVFPSLYSTVRSKFPILSETYKRHGYLFYNTNGLEFGGPSNTFKPSGLFPIYSYLSSLDNVTFTATTIWQGTVESGETFNYLRDKSCGKQIIADTNELYKLPSSSYESILSCHMLEHCANPIKHLTECYRILKDNSPMLIILPHRDATFDRYRPITSLQHLICDFQNSTSEDDTTHFDEILSLHDIHNDGFLLSSDNRSKYHELSQRLSQNFRLRFAHQHVFDCRLAVKLVDYSGFHIIAVEPCKFNNIIVLCTKPLQASTSDNSIFFHPDYFKNSPFLSDRQMHR